MSNLEKWHIVNRCENPEQLADAIIKFADENGQIMGRSRSFDAEKMAGYVNSVINEDYPPNLLTREFGIRQQAIYLKYCKDKII